MISALVAAAAVASVTAVPGTTGLGIAPAIVTGPASSNATFTIRDAGTVPEHVTVSAIEERPTTTGAWTVWRPFRQATVSPANLTLKPGQAAQVHVVVKATDAYQHRVAVAAQAQAQTVRSGAAVTPVVAAIYKINGASNPGYKPVSVPRPQPPSPGFPWKDVWPGAVAAACLAALATAGRKLKISRR